MQFRLVYQGRLPAASQRDTRAAVKHDIRRVIHKQLAELWKNDSFLRRWSEGQIVWNKPPFENRKVSVMYGMAENYARCGYRFLPLVSNRLGLACALDILFLRRDQPGDLIQSGGDIDNRIKVLFDALRMPQECNEVEGFAPAPDEDPFLCLLEDDRLITEVKVTTDRLLAPVGVGEYMNDVHLVIQARTVVMDYSAAHPEFWGS